MPRRRTFASPILGLGSLHVRFASPGTIRRRRIGRGFARSHSPALRASGNPSLQYRLREETRAALVHWRRLFTLTHASPKRKRGNDAWISHETLNCYSAIDGSILA
jgi:hypothetical protein